MAKLSTILDQIDAGTMQLPEFQRGYVWNRDQVRGLMRSLYHGYPVGALLVWETEGAGQAVRGSASTAGQKQLLLDGQQRVTTLYGIIRGAAPLFFEGDPTVFEGLRFHLRDEVFQFHAPTKMRDDPLWIDVTALFREGEGAVLASLIDLNWVRPDLPEYFNRLGRLRNVKDREFHVEQITGADKTVDVVVDIFNRANSGGTKLSKGDLALARICAEWSDARPTMRRNIERWREAGFGFTPDWLLRNANAVATGRAPFSALEDVSAGEFQDALHGSLHHIDHLLHLTSTRLGLDHDRVLMGRYAFPVLSRLLQNRGGRFLDGAEADKALFWFIHAALRGRFAGSTETFLAKDLEVVDKGGIDALIATLARSRRGGLTVDAQDFEGANRGSRSYPLVYLITRVRHARDLVSGRALGQDAAAVQVHEVFPKAALAKAGYSSAERNAVANFAFVTPSSAVELASRLPADYLAAIDPAVAASQFLPADPALWEIGNYREFLAARRELLASATGEFLDELVTGRRPWGPNEELRGVEVETDQDEVGPRAAQVRALIDELVELGAVRPSLDVEIADRETGRVLAVAEAFWPDGLQPGQGSPVVLELDPDEADLSRLAELGYEVFTSVDALLGSARRRNEVASGDRDADLAPVEPVDLASEDDGEFDHALFTLIERCRTEVGYNPVVLKDMAHVHGAVGAARLLLGSPTPSDGFVRLWDEGRLDLSVEALTVEPRFVELFTPEQLDRARKRLAVPAR
ncbi:hypothetical protein GCM10023215_15550 [Pseudonocardia yuanmonensis]|uniref:GmrSD restriction endonucleases N-terminal domain-containing protein n=1 Tax=Pseudonocardia yuanmonensis TaxID=1095914 RepID=A0ABP8W6K9_9PSEU